ncbi:MAG: hypothetical protein JNL74_09740, partial [Fibrobacteres bacterium]|nr:hypothetical protein [Fibrobacterota bacterium]
MKKLLSALLIIAAAANTYGEIKKSFSLNAETNLQYDGNILYPDSITGEASFISTTTFKPSLLLQPDKMSMFKISATASYTEQFKPIDHLLTTGLNLQYKRFLSSRSMVGALVTGSLSESNNSLLDERFVSGEVQGGRYLSPYTNLAGKLTGSLKNYPGLFKIDNGTNNYFYNFFDIKPQLALTAEHTENLSCKY